MHLTLSLANIAAIFQAAACLFLGVLLFKSQRPGTRWIGGFALILALNYLLTIALQLLHNSLWYGLVDWLYWTQFLGMPWLLWYARAIAGRADDTAWIHYVPAGLALAAVGSGYLLMDDSSARKLGSVIFDWGFAAQVLMYTSLIFFEVGRYRKSQIGGFASGTGKGLHWIQKLVVWIVLLIGLDAVIFPYIHIPGTTSDEARVIFHIVSSLYILWLCKNALTQHFPFNDRSVFEDLEPYQSSSLDTDSVETLARDFAEVMERERPYLDPELNLTKLATAFGVSRHILSEVLNRGPQQNFYEYVNGYRIEWVKQQLLNTQTPITQIALEAGFNNKVTFNQFFKKLCGVTPSQFRKNQGKN
ncbi:MAG: helix-turn-helix domain-containing protein [Alphaproteobacteria bacterium]|nr:helix-turn-helix domain-containing protein [Alphaproteobacteria bacterium]